MNFRILSILLLLITIASCSKSIKYSEEYKKNTSGRYLYNQDEVIDVFYDDNRLYLKWKGVEIKPNVLDENEFFVADMYTKLHFVQHPETKERYLSRISKEDENLITYDYLKVSDSFQTPRMYFNDNKYDKALEGFLELKKKDSVTTFIEESEINRRGYKYLNEKKYDNAIEVFKMNLALYPESSNVYDSLAEAYLKSGDSLEAYNNYKTAYGMNSDNKRAKEYIEAYKK